MGSMLFRDPKALSVYIVYIPWASNYCLIVIFAYDISD